MNTHNNVEQLVDDFKQAVNQLFSTTEKAGRLHHIADKLLLDARRLQSNRGIKTTTIGFFGPKNAGKSYLLNSLLQQSPGQTPVKTGYGAASSTQKLHWYGKHQPDDLDPLVEQFHIIDPLADTRLAREVVLVDIPGFSDPNSKTAAQHSLTSCQLKILVLDASEVEREDALNYGAGFDGAYILPVINRLPGDPDKLDSQDYINTVQSKLRHWAPHATCFAPVLLPYLGHQDVSWSKQQLADTLLNHLLQALNSLQNAPAEAHTQVALRIGRFRAEVRRELPEFTQAIEQVTEQIHAATAAISEDTRELTGGERIMQTSVRIGLGAKVVNETPAIFFPYRSIQRLLVMTSGAWESLTMGIAGSIPSLALTAVKAARNARDRMDWSQQIENGLRLRLEKTAHEKMLPAFQQLCVVLQQQQAYTHNTDCMPAVEVSGVDALMDESRRVFEQTIAQYGASKILNFVFGSTATLVFWALIAAPFATLYKDYVLTAWRLAQTQPVVFGDFPAIAWGVLFGALLLSSIPVFILAGLFLSMYLARSRVKRCVAALETAHTSLVQDMLAGKRLKILTHNAQLEAAQWLGGFLRK